MGLSKKFSFGAKEGETVATLQNRDQTPPHPPPLGFRRTTARHRKSPPYKNPFHFYTIPVTATSPFPDFVFKVFLEGLDDSRTQVKRRHGC
ncbi:hypothetical protein L1887_35103 [Cichorium endivia]|nr:hypothetical protein L1887_35103 [Cichorium endivia]